MFKKKEAGVESVVGGAPKKRNLKASHARKREIDPDRVEKMKKVIIPKKPIVPGVSLDGGIILE